MPRLNFVIYFFLRYKKSAIDDVTNFYFIHLQTTAKSQHLSLNISRIFLKQRNRYATFFFHFIRIELRYDVINGVNRGDGMTEQPKSTDNRIN